MGESIIHPRFSDIVNLLVDHQVKLPMYHTSLTPPLSDETLRTLLAFDNVIIEVGGVSAESKQMNMNADNIIFEDNLRRLLAFPRKSKIHLKLILNKNNFNENFQEWVRGFHVDSWWTDKVFIQPRNFSKEVFGADFTEALLSHNFSEEFPEENQLPCAETVRCAPHITLGSDGLRYPCVVAALRHVKPLDSLTVPDRAATAITEKHFLRVCPDCHIS